MASEMAEAMRQLIQEKGYTIEQVKQIIEGMLKAAYKRTYGTNVNAIVEFNEDDTDVAIYSRKVIVDGVYDPVTEIELEEAKELSDECEIGDEIDILIDPKKDFERSAVQTGKQTAHQSLSEIQKDSLMAEYKDKVGEIIVGYYQREKNGNIFVDLGKVEGIIPVKHQSPRETFEKNDRIKAMITELRNSRNGLQIVLSRTAPEFVKAILELEVPEIDDKSVEVFKIVREPGYRTKIAVLSNKQGLDPVGSCVGQKGVRIQNVIKELGGEKIDVLRYDPNPRNFIKNALSPAEVTAVMITDEEKKTALAVVPDSQFSLAIGKQGLNVRLANRLTDWMIDVKPEEECEELDSILAESREAAEELFSNSEYEQIFNLEDVSEIEDRILSLLAENGIVTIEQFDLADENGSLADIKDLSESDIESVRVALDALDNYDEEVDESDVGQEKVDASNEELDESDEEEYECPECGEKITIDMSVCPNCGVGLSFEFEDDEE
ncbi:MAG: transcription termination factor NusA [Treponemataceae bacterium]